MLLVYLKMGGKREFLIVHWDSEGMDCLACPEAEMRKEDPANLHIMKQMWESVQKPSTRALH